MHITRYVLYIIRISKKPITKRINTEFFSLCDRMTRRGRFQVRGSISDCVSVTGARVFTREHRVVNQSTPCAAVPSSGRKLQNLTYTSRLSYTVLIIILLLLLFIIYYYHRRPRRVTGRCWSFAVGIYFFFLLYIFVLRPMPPRTMGDATAEYNAHRCTVHCSFLVFSFFSLHLLWPARRFSPGGRHTAGVFVFFLLLFFVRVRPLYL